MFIKKKTNEKNRDSMLTAYWINVIFSCIPEYNAGEHKQFPPFEPSRIKFYGT